MLNNVYMKTLRDLRGLILAWGLGLAAAGALNVVFFPTFQQLPEMLTFLKNLPPVFKTFLGDIEAVFTLEGFLKLKLFDILPLLLSIFGISQGARALVGEIEHKTCDLLLAQPIPRHRVVLEKSLAIITATILIGALTAVGLLISCTVVGAEVNRTYLILGICNGLPLAWVFIALAFVGSATMSSSRRASVLAGVTIMTFYVFETLRLISPALSGWRMVSPFAHHRDALGFDGGLVLAPLFVFTALALLGLLAATWLFERRDLVG